MMRATVFLTASVLFVSPTLADERAEAELAYASCLMVGMENQIQLGKSLDIYIEACMRVKNWVKPRAPSPVMMSTPGCLNSIDRLFEAGNLAWPLYSISGPGRAPTIQ